MRMLWISFLLIGSISCSPPQGDYLNWMSSAASSGQDPSKPTHQKPPGQASGSGSYPGYYYSGTSTAGGAGSSGSGPQVYSGQSGAPGGEYQESWTSTDGEEPVFTPVHDEDQVYAFKSRSRYNQKRLLFSQFRYTPTEPLHPQEPVFQDSKGGF